jgi:hypothetical protein
MIIAHLLARPTPSHKGYLRDRKQFPLQLQPRHGPMTQIDTMFQQVKQQCPKPQPKAQRRRPNWISANTLRILDTRTALRRHKDHSRATARRLTREYEASLKADRRLRTEEAGLAIAALLDPNAPRDKQVNARDAYRILQCWYRHHGDRPFKLSRQDLQTVATEFATLYTKELSSPPVDPIPTMVAPYDIDDSIPTEEEIAAAVIHLKLAKSPGPSGMLAEYVREWHK